MIRIALLCGFIIAFLTAIAPSKAEAQQIIRDAEIEYLLHEFSRPIFDAAGVSARDVNIILVEDSSLNAFVAGGQNIFIYTGLILESESPDELIGVIAHETGHIAGAHLVRTREVIENASFQTLLASIIGIAAAVGTGNSGAGNAILSGGSTIAQQGFLSHSRAQEASADQAAVKYLSDAGMNAKGLLSFMEKLQSQEVLPSSQQSEYIRTHPLTSNRISFLQQNVARTAHKPSASEKWADEFYRIQMKIMGYVYPEQALFLPEKSITDRYARAIAHYRQNDIDKAIRVTDRLIAEEPNNPYFHELKGQILYENNRLDDAVPSYRRAVELKSDSGLLRLGYGRALMAVAKDEAVYRRAILHLERALRSERSSTLIHRLLATAYGRVEDEGIARLHLAEEAVLRRDLTTAKRQIGLAEQEMTASDGAKWLRLQDLKAFVDTL